MTDKKFILISGFNIHDNNRGTAALSYGAISFLKEKAFIDKNQILVNFRIIKNFLKSKNRGYTKEIISTSDGNWQHLTYRSCFY